MDEGFRHLLHNVALQPFTSLARLDRCRIEVPPTSVPGNGRPSMRNSLRFSIVILGLWLAILPASIVARAQYEDANLQPTQPTGYSHVRIVRLSFTEGTVTVQKPDVQEWAVAPVNTPIQEGFKLSTADQGFAEVEFENTTTARLGQLSILDFDQLVMTPSGGKVNRLTLENGYATFNVQPDGMDTFEVKALGATITLAAAATTRFRVDIDNGALRVEVFKGAANVSTSGGEQVLTKDMVADIRPDAERALNVTRGITKDAWDQWVDERENQELVVRNSPTPSAYGADNNGSYYGWNDLSNYGGWNYFQGYGYGWGPNVAFGWSPYSAGSWCWYPQFGYTWISSEPWGWLPYHNGGWSFMAGFGWAWFPGNFGTWYPGNVNWSQGAGWVAWSPNPPLGKINSRGCAQGQYCGRIIVRPDVVRDGRPVGTAQRLIVNAAEGRTVIRPDITPSRSAMLPGPAVSSVSAFTGKGNLVRQLPSAGGAQVGSGINRVVIGETPGVRTSGPRPASNAIEARTEPASGNGVVYDSASGRYVNTNTARPGAVNAQPGVQEGQTGGRTVAPIWSRSNAGPTESASPSQSGGVASTREIPTNSRISPGPVSRPSHSDAPTIRSTPTSSSGSRGGFWGGSSSNTSSGGSGHSSGVWSGGGSRSSGSSGGSYSGGGGTHSSGASIGGGSSHSSGGSSGGGGHSSGGTHK